MKSWCWLQVAALVCLVHSTANADIQAGLWNGRVDTSTPGGGYYRTWSSSAIDGSVISRLDIDQSVGTSHWIKHGSGTAPVGTNGVSATSYVSGSNHYEFVVYVATDGNLNIGTITNGGSISWTSAGSPLGRTLTGNIVVTTYVQGPNGYIFIGATTTDGHLFRFVGGGLPFLFGGWTDSSAGYTWNTTSQLATSNSPDNTISTIFATLSLGGAGWALGMVRWDGTVSTWSTINLRAPKGRSTCRSIASAQMSPTGTGDERVLVACTPMGTATGVDIAITTAYSSTYFGWGTYDTGTTYETVAAVARPISFISVGHAIDVYGSELYQGQLIKGVYNGSAYSSTNMGTTGDVSGALGGMGAVPAGISSRVFFVAAQGTRKYLYERSGVSTSSAPQYYRAFGDENPFTIPGGVIDHYAEGKISIWQGITATSMINRPGPNPTDYPQIYFMYSPDEGKTSYFPQQIWNQVGSTTYNYVSDPTTVVTRSGTMYSFQIGVSVSTCQPTHSTNGESIYYVTTSPTNFPGFTAPQAIKTVSGDSLDHPFADVQHRTGSLLDLIHLAWWDVGTNQIGYSTIQDGLNPTTPIDISAPGNGSPPRVTASDSGRVIVYYATGGTVNFCELTDTNSDGLPDTCCISGTNGSTCGGTTTTGWQTVDGGAALQWSSRAGLGPLVSGSTYIQDEYPVSMAISESGDRLYYCFDHLETSGAGTGIDADAFCSAGVRNPATGRYSWSTSPVVPVAGVTNDGKDQFMPEIVLTQESGTYSTTNETAIVTFYDRTDDPANYYYKVKKAVSTNRMASTFPPRAMFGGASSDPEYLPRHCFHPNARFIGDYSASEGYNVHAQSIAVTVPSPGTTSTAVYSNFHALGSWEN